MELIPDGVRVAVYNAMGGWGPYSVREIADLFRTYGFKDRVELEDVGGARRTAAEEYQQCIDWSDPDQRRRYLMLVEDVLSNYPEEAGVTPPLAQKVHRAIQLARVSLPSEQPAEDALLSDDLWLPKDGVRVFISHLASRREEVHQLARMLRAFGFACFVAHDAIKPSRAWLREIERALRSCELLVAYVTPGFHESQWTDQEVGWGLGRELIIIPVAVDGENPYGFFGTYQAVRRRSDHTHVVLSREVFRAISDAVFNLQRPAAAALVDRVALMVANAFRRSSSFDNTRHWFELLSTIPKGAWTAPVREVLKTALKENGQVREAGLDDGRSVPDAVRELMGERPQQR